MLDVREINTFYEEAHVLHDLSVEVGETEIVSLIGRNGAGKTTTLRSIMGLTPPRTGEIWYDGSEITGLSPTKINELGIGYVPENRDVFPDLTVAENLMVGMEWNQEYDGTVEDIFDIFPNLADRQSQKAGTLSGGEQQMLAIGQALVSEPDLLLVDEPTEGLMPKLVKRVSEVLQRIRADGSTILLVEQNMDTVRAVSDRIYVLSKGSIEYSGDPAELEADEDLVKKYLTI